jgi:hypothetical protein
MASPAMRRTLTRAAELVAAVSGEWETRRRELSRLHSEQAVVSPYSGLPHADALGELTEEYWVAAEEDEWGDALESFLARAVRVEVRRSAMIADGD